MNGILDNKKQPQKGMFPTTFLDWGIPDTPPSGDSSEYRSLYF